MALVQVEALIKALGNNFREFNILKVEALLELNRPEDAYNLSNLMVRELSLCRYYSEIYYVHSLTYSVKYIFIIIYLFISLL